MICAATWMNFNRIILSEVSWSQKDKYKDFPGDPVVKTQHFHCTGGACVQSLVRDLRSRKPFSMAKRKKKGTNIV